MPTIGVSALGLASLLCDEVSLAGFGYNLSQKGAPLHYYDHLPMSTMLWQKSHNVDRETELLQSLVREGAITDLTGGIHCSFCPSWCLITFPKGYLRTNSILCKYNMKTKDRRKSETPMITRCFLKNKNLMKVIISCCGRYKKKDFTQADPFWNFTNQWNTPQKVLMWKP